MAEKSVYTKVVAAIAVVLFGAMGYGGYRFIQAVSEGAAGIQNTASPVALPEISLEASAPLLPLPASDANDSVSTGEDVVIQAGDFSYAAGDRSPTKANSPFPPFTSISRSTSTMATKP